MNSYWKKSMWFTPMQMNFATPAAPVVGADGGGTGGGTPSGSGAPAAPAGGGAPAAPAQVDWNAANVPAQLREGYNKLKADYDALNKQYEPWKGLNVKPDDVRGYQQTYQNVYGEVKGIADALQINENEVADAIRTHGLLTVLDQLRYEAQQAEAANQGDPNALNDQELEQRINAAVEQRVQPVLSRDNARLVREGNILVENTITQLATDSFKATGLDYAAAPPELKDFILTGVTEALKYDDEGIHAVKFEGKTAAIQKAFQTFQAMWDAAYLARRAMETKQPMPRSGQPKPAPAAFKQPTLDEMMNNPDSIRTAQGKPAYST